MIQQRLEKAMGKKTDAHTHFDGTRTGKNLEVARKGEVGGYYHLCIQYIPNYLFIQ